MCFVQGLKSTQWSSATHFIGYRAGLEPLHNNTVNIVKFILFSCSYQTKFSKQIIMNTINKN